MRDRTRSEGRRQPLFVCGASRSGTALLRSSLNRHSRIYVAGETHYFDDLRLTLDPVVPLAPLDRRRVEDFFLALAHRPYGHGGTSRQSRMERGQLRERAARPGGTADDYFEAYCRLSAELEGARPSRVRWGEKTPRHVFRLPEMLSAYPDAVAVVMVRDPRGVVASYRDWSNRGGFDLEADPEHARVLRVEQERTRASYDPVLATLLWRLTITAARRAERTFGDQRVRIVRYEDLVSAPERTLQWLADWLGLDYEPAMLDVPLHNSSFSRFQPHAGIVPGPADRWRRKLSDREIAIIQSWAAGELREAGYESEAVHEGPGIRLRSLPRLAVALIRAARANRSRMGSLWRYVGRRVTYLAG